MERFRLQIEVEIGSGSKAKILEYPPRTIGKEVQCTAIQAPALYVRRTAGKQGWKLEILMVGHIRRLEVE